MDRAAGPLLEGPHAQFARSVLALKMKFLEMMDDDFNTAGAIGALHELAGEVNGFIERANLELTKSGDLVAVAAAGAQTLKNLGSILGLFSSKAVGPATKTDPLPGQLMDLLIKLRQEARASKNFALADSIRKGLTNIGITLEDRADGTGWRRE